MKSKILLLLSTLLICFSVLEFGLRLFQFAPRLEAPSVVAVLDPSMLLRPLPKSYPGANSWGYRDEEFSNCPDRAKARVLFQGDSFLMASEYPISEGIPSRFKKLVGDREICTFNLGVAGDGTDQTLQRYLVDGTRLSATLFLLLLYPSNDFPDLRRNRLFVPCSESEQGYCFNPRNPVAELFPVFRTTWLISNLRYGYLIPPDTFSEVTRTLISDYWDILGDLSNDDARSEVAEMKFLLSELKKESSQRSTQIVTVVIPSVFGFRIDGTYESNGVPIQDSFSNERMAFKLSTDLGIPSLLLIDAFQEAGPGTLYSKTLHLNEKGMQVVASEIANFLKQNLLLESHSL